MSPVYGTPGTPSYDPSPYSQMRRQDMLRSDSPQSGVYNCKRRNDTNTTPLRRTYSGTIPTTAYRGMTVSRPDQPYWVTPPTVGHNTPGLPSAGHHNHVTVASSLQIVKSPHLSVVSPQLSHHHTSAFSPPTRQQPTNSPAKPPRQMMAHHHSPQQQQQQTYLQQRYNNLHIHGQSSLV